MRNITLLPNQPLRFDEHLALTVTEIAEKRYPEPDNSSVMRVRLKLTLDGTEEQMEVWSDAPEFELGEYRFRYIGGWRSEVRLTVDRL
ncbi:MAG: hypothetical protein FJZ95_02070 [Chloroflexi bacterium]|nr:hypothetical protein [Chloroflexota bacterium]